MGESRKGLTRRDLLKVAGGTALAGTALALPAKDADARERENRIRGAKTTTSICPYCAVGCGLLVHSKDSRVIHIEGDPDHPINRGALCSKGSTLIQIANNPKRGSKPLYRAPGSAAWKEVEWDWALDEIALRVKKTRDGSFTRKNDKGEVVNRTDGIAHVGSAALDNEECYLLQKMMRGLGLVAIEHQARI